MKKITSIIIAGFIVFALSCTQTQVNDVSTPDGSIAVGVGTDNLPPAYTNDEATSGNYEGGQDNAAHVPTVSTLNSGQCMTWMHSNLPTWGAHFKTWMLNNGYSDVANMTNPDASGNPGFGGYQANTAPSGTKPIVILVHGNASKAQGSSGDKRGWFDTYKMLRDNGWNNSEIYAVNYLDSTSISQAGNNDMRPLHTNRVRRFIEAVYSYVNKYRPGVKLTVVAHSLGNTVTRGAMRDGNLYSKVETFVSIAGGNNGLLTCGTYVLMYGVWTYLPYAGAIAPTCSKATGFALPVPYYILYGVAYGAPDMSSLSLNNNLVATNSYNMWFNPLGYWNTSALVDTSYWMGALNNADRQFKYGTSTATRAYVILSEVDEINGIKASGLYGQRWWGPRLAGAYGTAKYTSAPYGHFGLKSRTTAVQKNMILRTYGSGDRTNPTY